MPKNLFLFDRRKVLASSLKATKEMPGTSGGLQGFIVLLAWRESFVKKSTHGRFPRSDPTPTFPWVGHLARSTTGIFGMWPVPSVLRKPFRRGLQNQSLRKTGKKQKKTDFKMFQYVSITFPVSDKIGPGVGDRSSRTTHCRAFILAGRGLSIQEVK